jgi:hypothetical protein
MAMHRRSRESVVTESRQHDRASRHHVEASGVGQALTGWFPMRRAARQGPKARWPRLLALALALFSVAFWTDAVLFHDEEGIESSQHDCPICQLQQTAGSGAPPEASVVLPSPAVTVSAVAECPVATTPIERRLEAWTQRGPPSAA